LPEKQEAENFNHNPHLDCVLHGAAPDENSSAIGGRRMMMKILTSINIISQDHLFFAPQHNLSVIIIVHLVMKCEKYIYLI